MIKAVYNHILNLKSYMIIISMVLLQDSGLFIDNALGIDTIVLHKVIDMK